MLGKIQKCRPVRSQTTANTAVRTTKMKKNTPRMEMHVYSTIFFIQIGANGNRHISTTTNAARPESTTVVHDVGCS